MDKLTHALVISLVRLGYHNHLRYFRSSDSDKWYSYEVTENTIYLSEFQNNARYRTRYFSVEPLPKGNIEIMINSLCTIITPDLILYELASLAKYEADALIVKIIERIDHILKEAEHVISTLIKSNYQYSISIEYSDEHERHEVVLSVYDANNQVEIRSGSEEDVLPIEVRCNNTLFKLNSDLIKTSMLVLYNLMDNSVYSDYANMTVHVILNEILTTFTFLSHGKEEVV